MKYKNEFNKKKRKKLGNAIKVANMISEGSMTFEQHYAFAKEGISTFEEQTKKLKELKKEEEIEKKEKEKSNNKDNNYNLIMNNNNYNKMNKDTKCNENGGKSDISINKNYNNNNKNRSNNINNINSDNKGNNNINKSLNDGVNGNINSNINGNSNDINKDNLNEKIKSKKLILGHKKKLLGRKRLNSNDSNKIVNSNNNFNSTRHRLMIDLICSIDDFIYNKRNYKINDYELFYKDIQLKLSQNKLNTNGFNVSINI